MADILSIGGMLVEIMRKDIDKPFDKAADLTGPYPSGDTPIFINAAAKLGNSCSFIGVVGDDGFGKCLCDRLCESGVDLDMVRVAPGATTGTAFVGYFSDGSRTFIYHWRHSAAGMIDESDIDPEKIKGVKWVHITGVTLSVNENCMRAVYKLLSVLDDDVKVCFDPNIRPEVLSVEEIRDMCAPIIARAHVIFPSKTEAMMFTGAPDDDTGCKQWAQQGKLVVLKNGEDGCRIFNGGEIMDVPSFSVTEVDPTGAGDTFCAAFVTALNDGLPLYEAGRFANAAGALSVLKKGPMEGAPTREEVLALLDQ